MTERTCGNLNVLGKVSEDVDFINNILVNDYASYSSMRALECFIDEKIHQEAVSIPTNVFPVFNTQQGWKKRGKTVGKGTYGSVNLDTIFKTFIVPTSSPISFEWSIKSFFILLPSISLKNQAFDSLSLSPLCIIFAS